jgi:cytoskeletal protein CcmA (bactofilin family)
MLVIDPVAMKIVNRVAPGTRQTGTLHCVGGLMIEGTIQGDVVITGGVLALMPEGMVQGKISCDGDAYLLGTILAREDGSFSEVDARGAAFLTETLRAQADITAGAIKTYEGAQIEGRLRMVKRF